MKREELIEWAMQEFGEYGVSREDVREGLDEVMKFKDQYRSDHRKMKGIREYLYQVRGFKIPFRSGRYRRLGEEI